MLCDRCQANEYQNAVLSRGIGHFIISFYGVLDYAGLPHGRSTVLSMSYVLSALFDHTKISEDGKQTDSIRLL
ncbi:hypothetical protein L596_000978 [Steinernema carpocapsae]|uniref:Uncharacterized protein n=1 Tax=Steinernema carpocapsae TaxID=34508 RepID=A0A4U8UM06_STECR|nr:hypothetical protein L596_000978 [Steinernema carpocapsae]